MTSGFQRHESRMKKYHSCMKKISSFQKPYMNEGNGASKHDFPYADKFPRDVNE